MPIPTIPARNFCIEPNAKKMIFFNGRFFQCVGVKRFSDRKISS